MRHYVLTRAAYGHGWSLEANRRRLELLRAVTAASLAGQSEQDFMWVVWLDYADPLYDERRAVLEGADVELELIHTDSRGHRALARAEVARLGYLAPWRAGMTVRPRLTTRLDDDDGLAGDAIERIQGAATAAGSGRRIWQLPRGHRILNGRCTELRWPRNAWVTLQDADAIVYDFPHRKARQFAPVKNVDDRAGWLWVRHRDTLSGRHHHADQPITAGIRALYPVDWPALEDKAVPA